MINPSKISGVGVDKSMGKQVVQDFYKMLNCLETKGKSMLGNHFMIYEADKPILFKLFNYFIKEEQNCKKLQVDLKKGILLKGPEGCGKTSLMRLLKLIVPCQPPYKVVPTRNVVFGYNHLGHKTIEDFGNGDYFCFDALGLEPLGRFFGRDCNVMGEILLSRYDLFIQHKIKTHATTNLKTDELEELYGERVKNRMQQLFNFIAFDDFSINKWR